MLLLFVLLVVTSQFLLQTKYLLFIVAAGLVALVLAETLDDEENSFVDRGTDRYLRRA